MGINYKYPLLHLDPAHLSFNEGTCIWDEGLNHAKNSLHANHHHHRRRHHHHHLLHLHLHLHLPLSCIAINHPILGGALGVDCMNFCKKSFRINDYPYFTYYTYVLDGWSGTTAYSPPKMNMTIKRQPF